MATNPFIVCKASAGSGKTFTLVKEYLKMAFAGGEEAVGSRFGTILAITYTRKAAAEMKGRIMNELQQMAAAEVDASSHTMGGAIMRELGLTDGKAMSRMAAKLLSAIMHRYSDLSVSTIDSFMHRVVRTFAHDLGQPMNFDVMIENHELIDEAVSGLMSLAGTEGQGELTDLLLSFANSQMEDDRGYNIERQLSALAQQLFKEDIDTHITRLQTVGLAEYRKIQLGYTAQLRQIEAKLRRLGSEMVALLDACGLDADNAPYGMSGYYGYFCHLSEGQMQPPTLRTIAAMEEGRGLTTAKAPAALKAAAEAALPNLQAKYAQVQQFFADDVPLYNSIRALLRNIYSAALLGIMDSRMRLYAHDNEVIHLSDFNRLINRVVQDEDNPAPFVYERLGNRYRHFLIDEFQDTSIMQWHNLVPLIENGVSQRSASLVVGDGKQAIYRFRQGDVRQFVRLPVVEGMNHHHGHTLALEGNYTLHRLDTNFRTAAAIVEFNNTLFSWLARNIYANNPIVQDIYIGADSQPGNEELRQCVSKSLRGYVGLQFVSKTDNGVDDVKVAIYDRVMQTIQMLCTERDYRYSDIVILARSNAELASISSHLSQNSNIPQTSTESFYLRESHAVMAILSVLRMLHDRANPVAPTELLHHLAAMGLIGADSIEAHCATIAAGQPLRVLDLNADYLASLDLYTCTEEIIRQLHLDGIDTPYVASLLGRVGGFAQRHKQDVGRFLEWVDEHPNLSAAASEEVDAVRLLTIHKAKGLEAPVVICPLFFGREHKIEMWVDAPTVGQGQQMPAAFVEVGVDEPTLFAEQQTSEAMLAEVDDLNILYVALTRPREQLYVICPDAHDIKKPRPRDLRHPALLRAFADSVDYDCGDALMHRTEQNHKQGKKPVGISRLTFADWSGKVRIASPSERALTPLIESKRRFGIHAHDLLSMVQNAADVDAAVRRYTAKCRVEPEELQRLQALAHSVVSHPASSRFFAPQYSAKCECEMAVGGRRERPDRIVFADGQVWVVDFKTGAPLTQHARQVAAYCSALSKMGYASVSGYLLYLQPSITVEKVAEN